MAHNFWPSVDDFTGALLTPETNFADPELQQAVALDERNQPAGDNDPTSWVGRIGVVFRMRSLRDPSIEWAVKCFKEPNRDRQHRYRSLAAHLGTRSRPPFLVDFHYLRDQDETGSEPRGIFVDGEWFPIVKMRWVEGQSLRDIVEPRLHNKALFGNLCSLWRRLVQGLSDAKLAHLDLQHGNVLWVQRGEKRVAPRLIDYDGMWIKSLAHLPSLEFGVEHYQHPDRHPPFGPHTPYCQEADRFSHLVIYTALRALAVDGQALWRRYGSKNMLFHMDDFKACRHNGAESPLFHELWGQPDESLRALAGRLMLAAHGPLEKTPAFNEIVVNGRVAPQPTALGEQIEDICPWLPKRYRGKRPTPTIGTVISNKQGMQFAWVPPGDSWLGGGGGMPGTTPFTLERGLWCGIYPVTQAEWQQVMSDTPSHFKNNPRYPVESVSWNHVQEFLAKINSRGDGYSYRLPTEQEWEYICRGGPLSQDQSKYNYYFANSKTDLTPMPTDNLSSREANFDGDAPAGSAAKGPYLQRPSHVGSYLPNPLRIYEMHGNVWEWTDSSAGSVRVLRGGSWSRYAGFCTASVRFWFEPDDSHRDVGFRLLAVPSVAKFIETRVEPTVVVQEPKPAPAIEVAEIQAKGMAGDLITNSLGMNFAYIPPGDFMMGSQTNEAGRSDNETQHKVTLTNGFHLGIHQVTQAQWQAVLGKKTPNPSNFKGDNLPVEQVSWFDAVNFCNALSLTEKLKPHYKIDDDNVTILGGTGFRLPTEAEWEYACRAGSETAYCFGDNSGSLGEYAWFGDNSASTTHPVGQKKPNDWGLFDMHGNVWEWCEDWYGDYPKQESIDPKGPSSGGIRVLRGGSFLLPASNVRSSYRDTYLPAYRIYTYGFRVARTIST